MIKGENVIRVNPKPYKKVYDARLYLYAHWDDFARIDRRFNVICFPFTFGTHLEGIFENITPAFFTNCINFTYQYYISCCE